MRGLRPVLEGARITGLRLHREGLRRPFPADLGQRLTGATIAGFFILSNYCVIYTDRGDTMIFHLGMSGRWRVDPAELLPHDHLAIETAVHRLALNDSRRFGSVDLVPTDSLADFAAIKALGPEPLGEGLTAAYLRDVLAGRIASIKLMLLDQRIVAGLGNIYVCEALFLARISPKRAAGGVSLAGRACEITPGRTASAAISPSSSRSMVARGSHARAAAPSRATARAAARPSGARDASDD